MRKKWIRALCFCLVLLLLAGCYRAPQNSEAPTDSLPPQTAPSDTAEVVAEPSWKDEVVLTSKSQSGTQKMAVRPNPYWANSVAENEEAVYYVATEGVKKLTKATQKEEVLYSSIEVYRISLEKDILYIWEMKGYGPYTVVQKKGILYQLNLQSQDLQKLWEFDVEMLQRNHSETIDEGVIHNDHFYLYEGSANKYSQLLVSVSLTSTKQPHYWPGFGLEEWDDIVREGAYFNNKLYYIKQIDNEESIKSTQLIELDLQTMKQKKIWETPETNTIYKTQMKGLVIYKDTLYAAIANVKSAGKVQLVTVDLSTGELSIPLVTIDSVMADLDFVPEQSGLYLGALEQDVYTMYQYLPEEKAVKKIYATENKLASFRVINGTLFYGDDEQTEYVDL